jgi:hypothetical protein
VKLFRSRFRLSSRAIRQSLGAAGVIISLVFVGMQIRESNIQARAGDYREIGISTAEFHRGFSSSMNRVVTESEYPEAVKRWTLEDWETMERIETADLRMLEMIQLQVEQGLLPPDAVARLGYNWGPILNNPAMACIWPELRMQVSPSVRKLIDDSTPATDRAPCQVDLQTLRDETIVGPKKASQPSIDGTYELTERVMADGTILRPPSVAALYAMANGHFNLNLFVKNRDGTIASESSVGRYTFTADKYCEWIEYTTRKDLDKPGVTNEAPTVIDHCVPVALKNGRFNFSPPGEGVEVSFGPEGFTAQIGGEFVDHWKKIR